jgi:hypothetical protein
MFINLSNHHSSLWLIEQILSAKALSENIIDMPFPYVPPDADEDTLDYMADETARHVMTLNPTIVHLMGEHTLCYRIANILKSQHVRVVASTTERDVVMEQDDVKRARFRFVRFRSY